MNIKTPFNYEMRLIYISARAAEWFSLIDINREARNEARNNEDSAHG